MSAIPIEKKAYASGDERDDEGNPGEELAVTRLLPEE